MKVETWEKRMAKAMKKQTDLVAEVNAHRKMLEGLIFQHPAFAPFDPEEVREVILGGDIFSDILYYTCGYTFEGIAHEVKMCVEQLEEMGEQALKLEVSE